MGYRSEIPTEEEFAFAEQKALERSAKEVELKSVILSAISDNFPCHDIWTCLSEKSPTISYIFPRDTDLERFQSRESKEVIESALEQAAQTLGIVGVSIDYHSHESVLKKNNGNYLQYFR